MLGDCVRNKIPKISNKMKDEVDKSIENMVKNNKKFENIFHESLFKNPYEQIRILNHALGKNKYKDFLKQTHHLSFHEMVKKLGQELNFI